MGHNLTLLLVIVSGVDLVELHIEHGHVGLQVSAWIKSELLIAHPTPRTVHNEAEFVIIQRQLVEYLHYLVIPVLSNLHRLFLLHRSLLLIWKINRVAWKFVLRLEIQFRKLQGHIPHLAAGSLSLLRVLFNHIDVALIRLLLLVLICMQFDIGLWVLVEVILVLLPQFFKHFWVVIVFLLLVSRQSRLLSENEVKDLQGQTGIFDLFWGVI